MLDVERSPRGRVIVAITDPEFGVASSMKDAGVELSKEIADRVYKGTAYELLLSKVVKPQSSPEAQELEALEALREEYKEKYAGVCDAVIQRLAQVYGVCAVDGRYQVYVPEMQKLFKLLSMRKCFTADWVEMERRIKELREKLDVSLPVVPDLRTDVFGNL